MFSPRDFLAASQLDVEKVVLLLISFLIENTEPVAGLNKNEIPGCSNLLKTLCKSFTFEMSAR